MPAGRPNKRNGMLHEEARSRIQTTQLINRLQNHGLGKVKMTTTQVQACKILLGKKLPDLSAVTLEGNPDGEPVRFILEGLDGK